MSLYDITYENESFLLEIVEQVSVSESGDVVPHPVEQRSQKI